MQKYCRGERDERNTGRRRRAIRGDERGIALPFAAIMITALLGMTALGVDIARIAYTATEVQNAADAAATAGLAALLDGDDPQTHADAVLDQNVIDKKSAKFGVDPLIVGHWDETNGTFTANKLPHNAVRAVGFATVDTVISGVIGRRTADVSAVATVQGVRDAQPGLPLALPKEAFDADCYGDWCMPSFHAVPNGSDDAYWTAFDTPANQGQIKKHFPVVCDGDGRTVDVSDGDSISLSTQRHQDLIEMADCLLDQGMNRFVVPVVGCPEPRRSRPDDGDSGSDSGSGGSGSGSGGADDGSGNSGDQGSGSGPAGDDSATGGDDDAGDDTGDDTGSDDGDGGGTVPGGGSGDDGAGDDGSDGTAGGGTDTGGDDDPGDDGGADDPGDESGNEPDPEPVTICGQPGQGCRPQVCGTFALDLQSVTAHSTKDLSNVVLHFADGATQKFEGLSGNSQTFTGTGSHAGKELAGVWIKSGCNNSGDGPGFGEYIEYYVSFSSLDVEALDSILCVLCPKPAFAGCMPSVGASFSNDGSSVDVSSTKDLSNVVLQLVDGAHQKFEGLSGHVGTFAATGEHAGKGIAGVWIKSGCNSSGDGPGYGAFVDNPSIAVGDPWSTGGGDSGSDDDSGSGDSGSGGGPPPWAGSGSDLCVDGPVVVGFATVELQDVILEGWERGLYLRAVFDPEAGGTLGGEYFGTGNVALVVE